MNRELQEYQIKESLKAKGIEPDLIDVHALIDESLTLPENLKLIMEFVGEQKAKLGRGQAKQMISENQEFNDSEAEKIPVSLAQVFKTNRVIGIVGNRSTGKTSLALSKLIELNETLKKAKKTMPVYVFGAETSIRPYLKSQGIRVIYSKEDILDLKLKNCILFIDEFASFFSTQTRDKECDKLKRFFARIEHNNVYVMLGTAETGFWNKFACSLIGAFIVKSVEYDNLVNGTWLKRLVLGIESTSDYRLELEKNEYFLLTNNLTIKQTFEYNPNLDSKKENINPFEVI